MSRCESPPACVRVKDAFVQTESEALEGVPVFFSTISGARLGPYKILRGDPLEAVRPRLRKCFVGRSGTEMSLSIDGKKWSKDFFLCMQCAVLACINKYKNFLSILQSILSFCAGVGPSIFGRPRGLRVLHHLHKARRCRLPVKEELSEGAFQVARVRRSHCRVDSVRCRHARSSSVDASGAHACRAPARKDAAPE
jgi:hypothetical protein